MLERDESLELVVGDILSPPSNEKLYPDSVLTADR
jgi:hypothetical protein